MGYIETPEPEVIPVDKKVIRKIWLTAGILALLTAVEFVFAFTLPASGIRNFIFIALTFVKAYYIIAEFMHLGHETKALTWSVLAPLMFLTWLILALNIESTSIAEALRTIWSR